MENEELKDILLEKDDEAKGAKLKKLLMFIAALVILFLIIIVAMKLINSSDSTQAQNEADSRLVLPPVPAEQPVDTQVPAQDTNSDVKKGDTQLFEQVPIVPENKQQDDFEDMIKKLKDKEGAKSAPKTEEPKEVVKAVEHPAEAPKKAETKVEAPAKKAETKSEAKAEKKAEAKPAKTEAKAEKKAETKAEKKPETKVEKKAEAPAKAEKVEKKAETPAKVESVAKGSYVQVFATSKFNPNADYMKKIAAKGYSYKTIKAGELTKILVGPFDEKGLQKAVNDIRKDVNKDAFVFRAK
ncbi:ABC transporter ATP-binding protein [Campylobacter concisus]|uniref:SPOR domain-containing protein n=1 Tax=Campylobacter concisus TaxID=199 RepID=UPI001883363D|nr:SPOR domain-containing protein [Campylobacter concisus]MBE9835702.1 ABC transporter ATP-binding protein [Campylobacter concisus]MBE9856852.1 ABC transporter ATP-binding protein [Campylobacter concisus]